jgi:hypothetical protein
VDMIMASGNTMRSASSLNRLTVPSLIIVPSLSSPDLGGGRVASGRCTSRSKAPIFILALNYRLWNRPLTGLQPVVARHGDLNPDQQGQERAEDDHLPDEHCLAPEII